jgi:hypothetical protein
VPSVRMARFIVLIETLSEGSCVIRVRAVDGFYLPPGRDVSLLVDPVLGFSGAELLFGFRIVNSRSRLLIYRLLKKTETKTY